MKHVQQKFVSEQETENVSGHEEEEAEVEAVDKQVGKKKNKIKVERYCSPSSCHQIILKLNGKAMSYKSSNGALWIP